jgi:hypothetical protein
MKLEILLSFLLLFLTNYLFTLTASELEIGRTERDWIANWMIRDKQKFDFTLTFNEDWPIISEKARFYPIGAVNFSQQVKLSHLMLNVVSMIESTSQSLLKPHSLSSTCLVFNVFNWFLLKMNQLDREANTFLFKESIHSIIVMWQGSIQRMS